MRPIERPPFYAVAVYPALLATSLGLVTDPDAQVLDCNGAPITGLYAIGNDMASVFRGLYPGPGATIGPAIAFAYRAATHAAKRPGARRQATRCADPYLSDGTEQAT
jgi:predicted oxidoreductase